MRVRGRESDPFLLACATARADEQGMPPAGAAWIALHLLLITPRNR